MKWEQYKELSKEDQQEWDFRWGQPEQPRISLMWVLLMWVLINLFASTALIILKEYVQVKAEVAVLFHAGMSVTVICLLAFCVDYAVQLGIYIYQNEREKKWIKKKIPKKK